LSDAFFQTLGLAATESDPAQCRVRVIANDEVVSAKDWHEVAHHVLPTGVVENPDQWPFFAWNDTPLDVVRTRDKKGYLFFGSDGGHNPFEGHLTSRAGSITVSAGTLDHPLGLPPDDPNPWRRKPCDRHRPNHVAKIFLHLFPRTLLDQQHLVL
jgi:hypothetical protein